MRQQHEELRGMLEGQVGARMAQDERRWPDIARGERGMKINDSIRMFS